MNALSSLLFIALIHSGQPHPEQPASKSLLSLPASAQAIALTHEYQQFVTPNRGIPGRRQGGGTR